MPKIPIFNPVDQLTDHLPRFLRLFWKTAFRKKCQFLWAACPSCHPTNSIYALKNTKNTEMPTKDNKPLAPSFLHPLPNSWGKGAPSIPISWDTYKSRKPSYNERTASVVLVLKSRNCLPRRVYPLTIAPLATNIRSRVCPEGPPSSSLVMDEPHKVLNTDCTWAISQVLKHGGSWVTGQTAKIDMVTQILFIKRCEIWLEFETRVFNNLRFKDFLRLGFDSWDHLMHEDLGFGIWESTWYLPIDGDNSRVQNLGMYNISRVGQLSLVRLKMSTIHLQAQWPMTQKEAACILPQGSISRVALPFYNCNMIRMSFKEIYLPTFPVSSES